MLLSLKKLKLKAFKNKNRNNSYFHSREYFQHRLEIEKKRVDRTNESISVLMMNFRELKDTLDFKFNNESEIIINEIVNKIFSIIRIIDVAAWYDPDTITILLSDSNFTRAQMFIQRMNSTILNTFANDDIKDIVLLDKIQINILTYPEDYTDEETKERKELSFTDFDSLLPKKLNGQLSNNLNLKSKGIAKRFLDIVFASAGLLLLSPLWGAISLFIKVTSPGPVIFTQKRIGYGGKCFNMFKFRSMYSNVDEGMHKEHIKNLIEENKKCPYKIENDTRITPFGRILRNTCLDELPQLLNVLTGDMSLVGPRPHPTYEVRRYMDWYKRRLDVKPGITGLWQIGGDNFIKYSDSIRLDLSYIDNQSLKLDFKILLNSIPIAFNLG